MTTEEKAKAYAENTLARAISRPAHPLDKLAPYFASKDIQQAYLAGAIKALASQWKDPKVELPEDDAQVVAHSPNGRIDVLTFHDGVFIDELGQAHCVDCWLPIPPLKGGDA